MAIDSILQGISTNITSTYQTNSTDSTAAAGTGEEGQGLIADQDKATISDEGLRLSGSSQLKGEETEETEKEAADKALETLRREIQKIKQELQELQNELKKIKNKDIPEETKNVQIMAKQEQIAQVQAQLARATAKYVETLKELS
jgi:predicted RNase H-like nuclease (RuvC/YqgF family)